MTITALLVQDSQVKLWGLDSKERLRRQVSEMGGISWLDEVAAVPDDGMVLLLNGNYLFEIRTLRRLMERPGSILYCPADGHPAAAFIAAEHAPQAIDFMDSGPEVPAGEIPVPLQRLDISDVSAFDQKLRFARPPLLELISDDNQSELENLLYDNSYRGITDLVTKFVWPRPAHRAVAVSAKLNITPNQVTTVGLILVIAATHAFHYGYFFTGLLAGWIFTFLDTVDGKLARVTIQSSRFGDLFDHGIDLFHPPFWYVFWGIGLGSIQPVLGFDLYELCWIVAIAYVGGRAIEGVFPYLGGPSVWTWQPFDAWFRLIVSRRNPCMIVLTIGALIGRPDWGFIGVVGWSVFCMFVLLIRLLQGTIARMKHGPLVSWLSEEGVAAGKNARSFRLFGGTRGAYGN